MITTSIKVKHSIFMNLDHLIPCPDSVSTLFGFLDPSIAPRLMYYAYGPIILVSLFFAISIYRKDKKSLKSKLLLVLAVLFSVWTINEILQWIAVQAGIVHFSWSMVPILQVAVILSAAHFIYVLATQKDAPFYIKAIFSALALPIILLTPTSLNYVAFDLENCEAINGALWRYIYIFNIFVIVLILFFLYRQICIANKKTERRGQIWAISLGSLLFFGAFVFTNIAGDITRAYEINLFGPIGMAAFIATMSFVTIRYKTFKFGLIGAQALVVALLVITGSMLFIQKIENVRYVLTSSIILVAIIGFILIRSVKKEVKQREMLAKLNVELESKNELLAKRDQEKSKFLRFASHDLKSPVGLIKQWASLIADGTYKEKDKISETLNKIKATADRSIQSVDDLLDINKIEEGRMDYAFETKDIVAFVKGVADDYVPMAKEQKNIDLTFETAVKSADVKIDTTRFRQVIQNLIGNSIKYTDPSTGSGQGKGWIKVSLTEEQKSILVTIKDSGLGMDAKLLPVLFEQFQRDPSVEKKIQGTGLGLYISKLFVTAHHGEIWAESEGKGKGSTFYVRLPKA